MFIKITKSVIHLNYGYRIGFTGDVPDYIAKDLVSRGRAVLLPQPKKEVIEEEPIVHKAVISESRKRKKK